MPGVRHTTKKEVLERFRDRLQKQVPALKDRVFIVTSNSFPENVQDKEFLTIQMPGGSFDYSQAKGGGRSLIAYQGTIRVSVIQSNRKDRRGISKEMLTADGGLLDLELKILSVMTGTILPLDADDGTADPENPDYGILTQEIYPVSDSEVTQAFGERKEDFQGLLDIDFGVDFTWDLIGN